MLIPSLMGNISVHGTEHHTCLPSIPQLVKNDELKKATIAPLKMQVRFLFSRVEQNASDPKTLSPGGETLPHPADRAWSWLQRQHSSSEQISTKPTRQHSCCSSSSPQLAHSAQRGRDLAAFFCSTGLFIFFLRLTACSTVSRAPGSAGVD